MKKKKNNSKKKGSLYRLKKDLTGIVVSGPGLNKKISIPSNSVGLMLKSKSYEATYDSFGRSKTQKLVKIRLLLDDKIVTIDNLPKGRLDEYFEKIKFEKK